MGLFDREKPTLPPDIEEARVLLAQGTAPDAELRTARRIFTAYYEGLNAALRAEAEGANEPSNKVPSAALDPLPEWPLYKNGSAAHATLKAAQIVADYVGGVVETQGIQGEIGKRSGLGLPPQAMVVFGNNEQSAGLLLAYLLQTPTNDAATGLKGMAGSPDWDLPEPSRGVSFPHYFHQRFNS